MHDPHRVAQLAGDVDRVEALIARKAGPVHLVGIGGVGVAGVAVMLKGLGLPVDGCDGATGATTRWLESQGIPVALGHDPAHLHQTERPAWLVRSPAVRDLEPELAAAVEVGIPVFPRGVVLPALLRGLSSIAVGGAHGKTTTTAMIAHSLRHAGLDASYCVGGVVQGEGGVAGWGASGWAVAEADESDGTLALYAPQIAVVTNVELDHVDYFETRAQLHDCFRQFGAQAKRVIYCADDPGASGLFSGWASAESFGIESGDWRADRIEASPFAVSFDVRHRDRALGRVELAVPGRHNVLNALAALAAAVQTGLAFDAVSAALAAFKTVRRRFDILAQAAGRMVISDYAHHPTEIRALMRQAVDLPFRRILAVFQPHRYTRTAALGTEFAQSFGGVDYLVLAPTYAAFEDPVPGGDIRDLARLFEQANQVPSWCADSLQSAWEHLRDQWREGDALLVVGAGDVEKIAFQAAEFLIKQTTATSSTVHEKIP